MEFLNKMARKFTKKASIAISDSVKTEAKKTVVSVLPTIVGIGFVIAGFSIFKASMVKPSAISAVAASVVPTISRTSIVTNNWFFGEEMKAEILEKVMRGE